MNANNRFMNYTIANIRVSLPDACTGEHFTRALRPFLTLGAGPADLALEIVPRIPAEADYREGTTAYMWLTHKVDEMARRIYFAEKESLEGAISSAPKHLV